MRGELRWHGTRTVSMKGIRFLCETEIIRDEDPLFLEL